MAYVDKIANLEIVQRGKSTSQTQIPISGFEEELNYFANAYKITNACEKCRGKTVTG